MLPAWRLATNNWAGRRKRFALLAIGAALATALVAAVSCALTSLNAGMALRLASTLGRADIRVKEVAGQTFDAGVLGIIAAQPEVELAVPRARAPIPLRNERTGKEATAVGRGVDLALESRLTKSAVTRGRAAVRDGEIVLDAPIAEDLGAAIGDRLTVLRWGEPLTLELVGINDTLTRRFMPRSEGTVTMATLASVSGQSGRLFEIQTVLRERDAGKANALAERYTALLPQNVLADSTARVTSGMGAAMRANDLFFVLISVLAFVASAIIIATGLTTGVLDRQRELAIVRCLGGQRRTLLVAQLLGGAMVGAAGAAMGVPLGAGLAWFLTVLFPDRLPAGFHVDAWGLASGGAGAVLCGVAGAVWPAVSASRVSPLAALSPRSRPPGRRGFVVVTLLGAALVGGQVALLMIPSDPTVVFYAHAIAGIPMMFLGTFLMGVPLAMAVARLAGPLLARALRVPRTLLVRSAAAAPFRNGFTAGALMVGLSIMTAVWTNGTTLLRDWLGAIDFADAFAYHPGGIPKEAQDRIAALDFVADSVPVTLYRVDSSAFGIRGLPSPPTNFIAFEPEPFFRMTKLAWVKGDPAYAMRRMREGGAVIVAKEFLVRRSGYDIGQTFTVEHKGRSFPFEIVGAVSSPGLDVVSGYFDVGQDYANQAIHAVFGSRADLQRVFGTDVVHMLQLKLKGPIGDKEATARVREAMGDSAFVVGSGREIKAQITGMGRGFMRIATLVAMGAMLLGCFAVLNVIVAGIDARRFEFGVVRTLGAQAGLLGRLVLAESLIIALTACVLGTALGLQGSMAALRIWELVGGLKATLIPPLLPIALGWALLLTLVLCTAAPFALGLARQQPRRLLAATRG